MKTVTTFDKADYAVLAAAQELAERIYLVADSESNMESVANRASVALADLISEIEGCPTVEDEDECPPCAGDCGECHCEKCVEDEPPAVEPDVLHSIIEGVMIAFTEHERKCDEKAEKCIEPVVTTPKGADLAKALAEIFGA